MYDVFDVLEFLFGGEGSVFPLLRDGGGFCVVVVARCGGEFRVGCDGERVFVDERGDWDVKSCCEQVEVTVSWFLGAGAVA